ncbi:MAG: NAD-dependent epimerase/dehydratase family protein [Bryobacterales bacterium]|nr:NAD-dependent epimerase/dehydratase family protein [Bryobacterales bacterium]
MQTILGANGQIAQVLARELHANYTSDLRLVSRNPKKVNPSDALHAADLLDAQATASAVAGSSIAYLTVGLPMDTRMWEERFPPMMRNVIAACKQHGCKLVFFDNTYMYPQTSAPQTEETPLAPVGRKGRVRAELAEMLLGEMAKGTIDAVICRAPEFYGPGKTQSLTNSMVFRRIRQQRQIVVPLSDRTKRTLIWTPDASRAMALVGNTPEAYGQTWHLPCDDDRLSYAGLIVLAGELFGRELDHRVLSKWFFRVGGLFNQRLREVRELLPRYGQDNIFVSDKFKQRFPDFQVTPYAEGVACIRDEQRAASAGAQ